MCTGQTLHCTQRTLQACTQLQTRGRCCCPLLTAPGFDRMQRIASGAAAAMSSLLRGLLGYYPCDEAAAVGFLPGTEVDGVPTEAWISIDGRVPASLAEDMRPTWHVATADEVGCLRMQL